MVKKISGIQGYKLLWTSCSGQVYIKKIAICISLGDSFASWPSCLFGQSESSLGPFGSQSQILRGSDQGWSQIHAILVVSREKSLANLSLNSLRKSPT